MGKKNWIEFDNKEKKFEEEEAAPLVYKKQKKQFSLNNNSLK